MRDEEYRPDQVAEYGVKAQPALVQRARRHLPQVYVGLGLAVCSTAASVAIWLTYPSFSGETVIWPLVAVTATALMLLICAVQAGAWRAALKVWSGESEARLDTVKRISFVAHVVSYALVLAGMFALLWVLADGGFATPSGVLAMVGLVSLVAAQAIGAVRFLRRSGPSGTLPAHIRRLRALERRRLAPPDPIDEPDGDDQSAEPDEGAESDAGGTNR
ncbi:hypothetical protein [Microlunatus sp. Y2014]|uniref:hypothetical protein n=1 Tax=Microlunatus sp. Y2014 TaxID=3418488 RepID=UPI003DA6E55E